MMGVLCVLQAMAGRSISTLLGALTVAALSTYRPTSSHTGRTTGQTMSRVVILHRCACLDLVLLDVRVHPRLKPAHHGSVQVSTMNVLCVLCPIAAHSVACTSGSHLYPLQAKCRPTIFHR
jgi:hypothetical protein